MTTTANDVIRIAHSPDSDDAFMFYGLAKATDVVDTEGLTFSHHLCDIETLNNDAMTGKYELTAISYHAYAHVKDKYALLDVGQSIGDKYGPVLIANQPLSKEDLKGKKIAVPGNMTSAYLALKIWEPTLETVEVPFDQIMARVKNGEFIAGVIIHEGQLTYAAEGFTKIVDFGEWWFETTNLPLPLGSNAIRRDLGEEMINKIARVLKRSIAYSLANREKALDYAMEFSRGLERDKADKFVGMYVNEMTMKASADIKKAVRLMLYMGHDIGLIDEKIDPEFISVGDVEIQAPACSV